MTHLLACDACNVVIVGNGAIGTALARQVLQHHNVRQLFVLQRQRTGVLTDARVNIVTFDAEHPSSISAAAAAVAEQVQQIHLMINTVGMLHSAQQQPEKRLRNLESENLQRAFCVNAMVLPLLVQAFSGLLRHRDPAVVASLSARVGSIEDNHLGGWYSYRAAKAAHNMLLRTIALEWRVTHRNAIIVALHPGTVQSPLSAPFISANYKHPVRTPEQCAASLLQVLDALPAEASGQFYDWQGSLIPW